MFKHRRDAGPAVAEDLDVHRTEFIASLVKAGYAEETLRDKRRLITAFLRWATGKGIAAQKFDEACVSAFLDCPSRRRYGHRTALQQFVEHLRADGVAPCRAREASSSEVLIQRYFDYLRSGRGLSPRSLAAYSPVGWISAVGVA